MKKENKKMFVCFFANFLFTALLIGGLVGIWAGMAEGVIHMVYGVVFTAIGLIGIGFMREYWREKER